jgi:hypothetical protein
MYILAQYLVLYLFLYEMLLTMLQVHGIICKHFDSVY